MVEKRSRCLEVTPVWGLRAHGGGEHAWALWEQKYSGGLAGYPHWETPGKVLAQFPTAGGVVGAGLVARQGNVGSQGAAPSVSFSWGWGGG